MAKNAVNEVETSPLSDAKAARAAIFADSKPKVKKVTFKGVNLEIRQPSINAFLSGQDNPSGESRSNAKSTIQMVIDNTYLAGTDDKVFEASDLDSLIEMPISGEWLQLIQGITELLDIKVEDNVKN